MTPRSIRRAVVPAIRVYEIPAEDQIRHADGITFVRIPAYDSPCFVTERAALDVQ